MFSPYLKTPQSGIKGQQKSISYLTPSPRTPRSRNCSLIGHTFNASMLSKETCSVDIQRYGSPLPVLVTEAMGMAERPTDISVKLEPFGYASLVCGRQLLIWKYKLDTKEKAVVHCHELTLPPSDLAHKADLVHLFQTEDAKLPSALAVSPEGHVRYWPNINHEGSSVDTVTDLQGQECHSIVSVMPLGCILSTTTCSLVLITPTIGDGQPNVICRPLTLPLGVLAGIGRKVSSFIFGVVPTQTSESKQLNRVLSVKGEEDDYFLYVLSSSILQKWHVLRKDRKENSDQLLFETDLDRPLKQRYADDLFKRDSCLLGSLKTWCLDMQLCSSGVMIFTACTLTSKSDANMHYAFGEVKTSLDLPPEEFSLFHIAKIVEPCQVEQEELLNYKFILPTPASQSAFIYNLEHVQRVNLAPHLGGTYEFKSEGHFILGSGTCDGVPLFFFSNQGIVSFLPSNKSIGDTRFLSSMKEVTIRETGPSEPLESLSAYLSKAMFCFYEGNKEECERLLDEMLPKYLAKESNLDEAVIAFSSGLINDYPASDPRWQKTVPDGLVSSSLIISYQLEDKLKAIDCLYSFLKAYKIIEKLSSTKVGDLTISTNLLLCEHAEKLVAAKTIRLYLADHLDIIENAIQDALKKRGIEVKDHLTAQDVFFREVSTFHTIFPSLLEWEKEELAEDESMSKILNVVMTVNKLFMGLLDAVSNYRINEWERYSNQDRNSQHPFLPWTAREGNTGIRAQIREQLHVNVNHALKITDNIQIQGVLYQQFVEILDFFLGSYKYQLETTKMEKLGAVKEEYEKERHHFIKALLSVGQYERAAAVAEKYQDFGLLIQICEDTQDGDRMQRYMLQFAEEKFSEFVFKWYLGKGQRGKIFSKELGQREVLGNFLQEHDCLKWLHYIQERQYDLAHVTLKQLALKETQFLNRKKTLLSLSKLTAMVSSVPAEQKRNQIESINLEQDLITHQEALPLSTVEALGLDPRNMRVFQPDELIEMYITDENPSSNAYDFKIALDLLNFIKKPLSDPEVNSLRMHIWAKAVLKDKWEEMDVNNPLETIKETVFFQVIELAFDQGIEMHDFIPPIEELLQSPELSNLSDSPSFKFLLQAGYEHILKIID